MIQKIKAVPHVSITVLMNQNTRHHAERTRRHGREERPSQESRPTALELCNTARHTGVGKSLQLSWAAAGRCAVVATQRVLRYLTPNPNNAEGIL